MKNNEKLTGLLSIYQSAIQLKTHEGDLVWSRFNGFVVTHTIFFLLIGQILLTEPKFIYQDISLIGISIVGFILSFLWLISTVRGFESVGYWGHIAIELAVKINREYNLPNVFSRGKKYFKENREITFDLGREKEEYLQRSLLTQLIRFDTRLTAYLSIGLVLLLYVIVFIATFYGLFNE